MERISSNLFEKPNSASNRKFASIAEVSELWNFSVRVQSWPEKIESVAVLIRKIFKLSVPLRPDSSSM